MRRRRIFWSVALVGGLAVCAAAAGLVFTDAFRTTVSLTVENRRSEAVIVGIADDGIGCGDSELVAANTTTRLELRLHGQSVLCIRDGVETISVRTADGTHRECFWDDVPSRRIVITADGPDCAP